MANWILDFGTIEFISIFFALANIFTGILYVVDKRRAINNKWRIRESVLIFFTLAGGGIGALLAMCFARHKTRKIKFRVAVIIGLAIAIVPLIHIVHGLTLDKIVRYVEIEFRAEGWPEELNGYRIAFMSDFHIITNEAMRDIVTGLNNRNIDLLLLGGDFSMPRDHYQSTLIEISQTHTTDGIFGVGGNHDNRIRLLAAMEQNDITLLDNSGYMIRDGFYLAGVQDVWRGTPDVNAAIAGADVEDFILLVSHNPDVVMHQTTNDVGLVLTGHTHGGLITFFGFPIYLFRGTVTQYGTRFGYGFAYSACGVPVFTSRGVGVYYNAPRIFARPEVVIFTMLENNPY